MSVLLVVGVGALVGLAAAGALLYNGLIRARLRTREAWSAVDVQLQRRQSLIPNLVEVVKGFAGHEQHTLTRVMSARGSLGSARGPRAVAGASDEVSHAVQRTVALAEAYPDLKADTQFARLQAELADTEDNVAYARNYYNGAVDLYNTRVQTVPGNLIAALCGFRPAEFFRADARARSSVEVELEHDEPDPSR